VRIVSWNLGRRQVACERLWSRLAPDIALVQEISAEEITRRGGVGRDAAGRRFGSAVLARPGLRLTEVSSVKPAGMPASVDLRPSWPGAVAVAELADTGSPPLTFVSLHALFESGWGFRSAHRLVGDLIYLFADRFRPRTRGPAAGLVVAGDFNISTQFDPPWDAHARLVFAQLDAYGLVNPLTAEAAGRGRLPGCRCSEDPCPHFETWRRRGQPGTKPRLERLSAADKGPDRSARLDRGARDRPRVQRSRSLRRRAGSLIGGRPPR